MTTRHKNAISIQQGACNPSGICHSLVEACSEVVAEKGDTNTIRQDPAIRLMVHQLAFLMSTAELDNSLHLYMSLVHQCEECFLTVDEMAARRGIRTYDTALPQSWVNKMISAGFDPTGRVVWSYDSDNFVGEPIALTIESARLMKEAIALECVD